MVYFSECAPDKDEQDCSVSETCWLNLCEQGKMIKVNASKRRLRDLKPFNSNQMYDQVYFVTRLFYQMSHFDGWF